MLWLEINFKKMNFWRKPSETFVMRTINFIYPTLRSSIYWLNNSTSKYKKDRKVP